MKTIYVDTHTHTNTPGSDGEYSVVEQIKYAYESAYELFRKSRNLPDDNVREVFERDAIVYWAITDHNTYKAFDTLAEAKIQMPKNFILHTGVEYEAYDGDFIFDVTVHGIKRKFKKSWLAKHYMENVVLKKDDLEDESAEIQYKAFLEMCGYEIPELLEPQLRYRKTGMRANDLAHDAMYTRLFEETQNQELIDFRQTEIAKRVIKYMSNHGYDPTMGRKSYYRNFICNKKSPWYLDQTKGRLSLEEIAYHALHEGAIVHVSHPGIYDIHLKDFVHEKYEILLKVAKRLEKEGISVERRYGFECGHRNMTMEQTKWIIDFCNKNNLVFTAESDFHKPTRDQVPFHICGGTVLIDAEKHISPEWFNLPTYKEWVEDYENPTV